MNETPLSSIMKKFLRIVITLIFAAIGYQFSKSLLMLDEIKSIFPLHPIFIYVFIITVSLLFGFFTAPVFWMFLARSAQFFENKLQNINIIDLITSLIGLIIGLMVANLIALPIARIPGNLSVYLSVLLNISFGYLGLIFFLRRKKEFVLIMDNLGEIKSKLPKIKRNKMSDLTAHSDSGSDYSLPKILDTSAIIDGRILDVAKTGFLEGTIILPHFVLTELQNIADSTDPLRRTKGRRGLSVVSELKKLSDINIDIHEITTKELERDKVDEALVVLAQRLNGKVITTDYNLNQVANIEGVSVLNVNELSNSLKPLLLPGEVIDIDVIRLGKENNQGVGYLDDGTMLVVEDGQNHVGERVTVTITSMLQTSAGRMVFGRIRNDQ